MSEPQDILEAVAAKLEQVTGLRGYSSHPGNLATPAAICEVASITAPSVLGPVADYSIRVYLLVQAGDKRNTQERTLELVSPAGTTATSALVALLDYTPASQVLFEGPGIVEYGGQQFHGGIFTLSVMG